MKKRILCLLLALLIPCLAAFDTAGEAQPLRSTTVTVEGETTPNPFYTYEILPDGTAKILRFRGNAVNRLALPERIDGYPVSTLGTETFQGRCLDLKIFIPETLTVVEGNPFDFEGGLLGIELPASHPSLELVDNMLFSKADHRLICAWGMLHQVSIPEGTLSVEDHAFRHAEIEYAPYAPFQIPASVTHLGKNPFCNRETYISYTLSVAEGNKALIIVDGMLFSLEDKRLVCCADSMAVPDDYQIPNGTEILDDYAFVNARVWSAKAVNIPSSVRSVGDNPFYGCKWLEQIVVDKNNESLEYKDGALYSREDQRLVCAIATDDRQLVIQEGTRIIGDNAFCIHMVPEWDIVLPDSVETIGDAAACGQRIITSNIPRHVRRVGAKAFYGCFLNCDLVFLDPVELGDYAFAQQSNGGIQSLTAPAGACIGNCAFSSNHALENVTVFGENSCIGQGAFNRCSTLREVFLGEGVYAVDSWPFADCSELDRITLPESLTYIGDKGLLNAEEKGYDEVYDSFYTRSICTMTVTVAPGSYAEKYCQENGIDCCYPGA
ncbi:MAG: leucine-rich repeat protein [Oscillospiraceae bacterium]|nr:leucine-rich repeat protein [Oscillospiraceae bacterium]MBR3474935.1 leucine-rich repeat protein [Oscillospiraceae bacterium]